MTRFIIRTLCVLSLIYVASIAAAQTEFSADMFDSQRPDSPGKIYFGKDKIRFESGKKDARGGGVFIMNLATQMSTAIMDQQHMYMELPAQIAAQRNPYHFFRTGDVDSACADWLAQSWNQGGTCHKVGNDTVNGRNTVKFEGTNSRGESGTMWLDPKLRFPVKWEGKGSTWELRNIQEGSQPSSLFEIPAVYKKFDMGAMMGQHQQ
jgi:hypothetical protein